MAQNEINWFYNFQQLQESRKVGHNMSNIIISRDTPNSDKTGSKQYTYFSNYEEVIKNIYEGDTKNYYEIIQADDAQRMRYDIDLKNDKFIELQEAGYIPQDITIKQFIKTLISTLSQLTKKTSKDYFKQDCETILFNSSTFEKQSYHMISKGFCLVSTDHHSANLAAQKLYSFVIQELQKELKAYKLPVEELIKVVDKSVYSKLQNFRTVGCCKKKKKNIKKCLTKHDSKESFICNVGEDSEITFSYIKDELPFDIVDKHIQNSLNKTENTKDNKTYKTMEYKQLLNIVKLCDSNNIGRRNWYKMAQTLYNIAHKSDILTEEQCFHLFHQYSKYDISNDDKYVENDDYNDDITTDLWNNLDYDESLIDSRRLTVASIKATARKDHPEQYQEWYNTWYKNEESELLHSNNTEDILNNVLVSVKKEEEELKTVTDIVEDDEEQDEEDDVIIDRELRKKLRENLKRGDEGLADIFVEYNKNIKIFNNKGNCFIYNESKKLWLEKYDLYIGSQISLTIEPLILEEIKMFETMITEIPETEQGNNTNDKKLAGLRSNISRLEKVKLYILSSSGCASIIKKIIPKIEDVDFVNIINTENPDILPVKNGILCLKTGQIRERNINDLFSFQCPVSYKPIDKNSDDYKKVDKFFLDVCKDNENLKEYLRVSLGYMMTGHVSERCYFTWYGIGSNGKSTVCNLLQLIMNKFYTTCSKDIFIKSKNNGSGGATTHLTPLIGARIATFSESDENEQLDSAQIKNLCGGEKITYRKLYCESSEFKPICKLILQTNHKPKINSNDDAIKDRIRFIPFNQRFTNNPTGSEKKRDAKTVRELENELLDVVFQWIIEGSITWYGHGLPECEIIEEAKKEYINDNDIVGGFIKEMCNITDDKEYTTISEVRAEFERWCKDHEKQLEEKKTLTNELKAKKYKQGKKGGNRVWLGIALNKNDVDYEG